MSSEALLHVLLYQSPGRPFGSDGAGRSAASRVVLVRHAATEGSRDDILLGVKDEPLSVLGGVQAGKAAELLLDLRVSAKEAEFSILPHVCMLKRQAVTYIVCRSAVHCAQVHWKCP